MLKTQKSSAARSKKSTFRKVSEWLHLWLGLISGIIVFVVCFTGGLWVFRYEVWHFTEKYQQVEPRSAAFMKPSALISRSSAYLFSKEHKKVKITGITYGTASKAAIIGYQLEGDKYYSLYLNPYSGEVIRDKRSPAPSEQFFIFVRAGHRFFWLPKAIGSPIVGAACIIFVITLITGLIWWFPLKWTKKTREKSFSIKWGASWKRLNIDLHNVLGFYTFIIVMALTISGIVFTFDWFEAGMYKALTWKTKSEGRMKPPLSDTIAIVPVKITQPGDVIWVQMAKDYQGKFGRLAIDFPGEAKDPYQVIVQFGDGTLVYNNEVRYFDQRTLREIKGKGDRSVAYRHLSTGEKVFRMNFDIHTGQILGLPTKILAFFACMIGAGLPVTGFIIWYNRKWGKKKKKQVKTD